MNKNDLRYIKTEALIRDAFLQAVEEVPFERVPVSLICHIACISRFTFYTHYEDKYLLKDALLRTLEENLNSSIDDELLDHAKKGDYYLSAERYVRSIRANRRLIRVLMKCDRSAVSQIITRTYLDASTALYVENYMDIVSKNTDIQFTRSFFLNALVSYAETLCNEQVDIPEEEMIRQFYELIAHTGSYYLQQLKMKSNSLK